jgi:hypothetical protein
MAPRFVVLDARSVLCRRPIAGRERPHAVGVVAQEVITPRFRSRSVGMTQRGAVGHTLARTLLLMAVFVGLGLNAQPASAYVGTPWGELWPEEQRAITNGAAGLAGQPPPFSEQATAGQQVTNGFLDAGSDPATVARESLARGEQSVVQRAGVLDTTERLRSSSKLGAVRFSSLVPRSRSTKRVNGPISSLAPRRALSPAAAGPGTTCNGCRKARACMPVR